MARVKLIGKKAMNKIIAVQPEVQAAVRSEAATIKHRAEVLLAPHRKTGDHHIEMGKNLAAKHGLVDYEVSLVGEAPASVEFGHWLYYYGEQTHQYVPGLYIITRASGLI